MEMKIEKLAFSSSSLCLSRILLSINAKNRERKVEVEIENEKREKRKEKREQRTENREQRKIEIQISYSILT